MPFVFTSFFSQPSSPSPLCNTPLQNRGGWRKCTNVSLRHRRNKERGGKLLPRWKQAKKKGGNLVYSSLNCSLTEAKAKGVGWVELFGIAHMTGEQFIVPLPAGQFQWAGEQKGPFKYQAKGIGMATRASPKRKLQKSSEKANQKLWSFSTYQKHHSWLKLHCTNFRKEFYLCKNIYK